MWGQEKTFPNLSYHAGTAISTGLRPRITAWALKNLMQSTHIYRVSGVAGYKRKKYAAYGKGRAEFPEPDFACRSFRAIGILLGSAVPKPCCTQPLLRRHHTKIGSKQQQRVRPKTGHTRLQLRLKNQYLQSPECVWVGRHKLRLPALSAQKRGGRRQSMARSVQLDH